MFEIAVVGGGPAGLSAAYSAAKAGAKVILLEKDDSIGHNIRTSGVTWIDDMERLGITDEFYNPITNYSFISPSTQLTIKGEASKSCVLDVRRTWQHLAFLAAEAGAKIMIKTNVVNVQRTLGKITNLKAHTPKGDLDIECRLVIDASGFSTAIGRKVGVADEWKRYGVGAEYECFCENVNINTWVLMVGQLYSDAGYAWIFPVSKNRARIGVGIGRPESSEEPIKKLHSIIENKLKPIDEMGKVQPIELHYGIIPNQGLRRNMVSDGLIMVGDSAGQANPLVLEGIRYAIEFGRLAGQVAVKSMSVNSNAESLFEYERICRSKIESKINTALKVQSRWLGLSDEQWDKELEILRDMSAVEFLDFIKADFTAGKIMNLAFHHPRLAARQLFAMFLKT